jgi:multidrug efflux pump
VNRFNFFDRSYKVIPQIGDEDRATLGPLLDLKIKTPKASSSGLDLHAHRVHHRAAHAQPLPAAQRGARLRGVKPGVTKEEGLRVLEDAARAAGGPNLVLDYGASRARSAARARR